MGQPHHASFNSHSHAHRVIASLNRAQVDYLDKLGKDAQFSSGIKLSRAELLAAMVNALKRLDLDGEGLTTAQQFEQRIVDAMLHTFRSAKCINREPLESRDRTARGASPPRGGVERSSS